MGQGSPCGLDLIPSIDTQLNNLIFPAPITYPLKDHPQVILKNLISHQGQVSILQVPLSPEKKNRLKKVVIYSHGNAEDLVTVQSYLQHLHTTFQVVAISYDYPHYGKSEGKSTESSCTEALAITVRYVVQELKISVNQILLVGFSIGTGIVVNYAFENQWLSPLLLIAPYKSVPRIAFDRPWMDSCVHRYKFQSIRKLPLLKCPIQIVHGVQDTIIPISHSQTLFQCIPKPLQIFEPCWIQEANHNDVLQMIPDTIWIRVLTYSLRSSRRGH